MKIFQIINAIPAFNKLGNSDMPLPDAYKLQKLITALQPDIDFFNERNSKIIQKYDGKIRDNGTIEYPEENRAAAQEEFNELLLFDTQTEITDIKIPINKNRNERSSFILSANDIGVLLPFVKFIDTEEK